MGVLETNNGDKLALEANGAAHIPYSSHVDPYTLKTNDGKLVQIIKLEGVPHETSDTSQLNNWKSQRNFLWRSISDSKISIWTHTVRYEKSDYPKGNYDECFAKGLDQKYKKSLSQTKMFVNDLYICVVRNQSSDKIASFAETIKGLIAKTDKSAVRKEQRNEINALNDVTRKIVKGLSAYNPVVQSVYTRNKQGKKVVLVDKEVDNSDTDFIIKMTQEQERELLAKGELSPFSAPLEFIGFLVNGFWRKIPLGHKNAGQTALNSKITFNKDCFVIEGNGQKRCGATLSIKEYTANTAPGMIDGILTLPVTFVLTQSFTFMTKTSAVSLMKTHQNRLKTSGDLAESQIEEIDLALDALMSNDFCMGEHHLTLTVLSDSYKKTINDLTLCESEMSEIGLLTAREYLGIEPCFWAQLPGNHAYISRQAPITSKNFSAFSSLHNYPRGKLHGNHWGEAIALLKTISGTPYYFNFHYPKDLGNSTVIGPSGAGKTVLMLFMAALLEKHKPTQVFFDKDRGAEIFIRAQGGLYSPIEAGKPTGFNPLQLPDTEANRKFLRDWLARLLHDPRAPLTAEQYEEIATAVNGNYKLEFHERRLYNISAFFQIGEENGLKARLKNWLQGGDKGWVFDNEEDSLSLDSRLIGFDVTDFLEDPVIRTPLLMYLFHRVDSLMDGRRFVKWMDEGWKLLDDEYFGKQYKNKLKVIRKQNGFTVFGTQEPHDVISSAVGKTIMSQSPTKIFLPNPEADYKDYVEGFKLTEREYELIRSLAPDSRCFLIKQGQKSVVAELNLSGMEEEISILSGTTANVELLTEIREEVGNDPKDWMPIFHERRDK